MQKLSKTRRPTFASARFRLPNFGYYVLQTEENRYSTDDEFMIMKFEEMLKPSVLIFRSESNSKVAVLYLSHTQDMNKINIFKSKLTKKQVVDFYVRLSNLTAFI